MLDGHGYFEFGMFRGYSMWWADRLAREYGAKVESVGPMRSALIKKGMIWSPAHGDTAFTVPMFDEFMRRTIPDWRPGQSTVRDPAESRSVRTTVRGKRRSRRQRS